MNELLNTAFKVLGLIAVMLIHINVLAQPPDNTWDKEAVAEWYNSHAWLNNLQLTPHPSIDQQEFAKQYRANKVWWDKAFEFLKTNDLASLAPGRYTIDEGNVFAMVSEAPAIEIDQVKWESHKNFNDLQYIIKGKVKMGVAPVSLAKVKEAYDSKKDIAFYDAEGEYYEAEPGTFFIFSPKDAHRPAIKVAGNDVVKKVVIKIRTDK